jgi:hypothetical protein
MVDVMMYHVMIVVVINVPRRNFGGDRFSTIRSRLGIRSRLLSASCSRRRPTRRILRGLSGRLCTRCRRGSLLRRRLSALSSVLTGASGEQH